MYASEQLGVPAALFCVRDGSRSFAMPEALLLGKAGITSYEVIRSDIINMSDPLRSDSLHYRTTYRLRQTYLAHALLLPVGYRYDVSDR